ncbi:hypothetical protein F5Y14DRAFT_442917 [Nemania sp. NC0429]|nr:hypothetical protein F5Y14DRAFT_442917 [Nemania sp. NC0429]
MDVYGSSMPVAPGSYWDLLERNTPPVKRRATHAKARTGCLTCKKRRVKCDEAKPHCARCIKSGHRCVGYQDSSDLHQQQQQPKSRRTDSSADDRPGYGYRDRPAAARLLPRLRPLETVPGGRRVVVSSSGHGGGVAVAVDLAWASLTPAYLDAQDAFYFERFKCQMLVDLGVWCGAEYWRHTILREVMVDKMVQHAALGAAAMIIDIEQQQQEHAQSQEESDRRSASPAQTTAEGGTAGATIADGEERTETALAAENEREEDVTPPAMPVSVSGKSAHGKASLRHYTAAISLCRRNLAAEEGLTSSTARSSLTVTFFFAIFELVQGNVGEADRILANGVSLLDHALSQTTPDGRRALVADDELRQIQLAFDRMCVAWGLCPYFGDRRDDAYHARTGMTTTAAERACGVRHFELPSLDVPVRTKQVFWNAFSSDFGQFMMRVQRDHPGSSSGPDLAAVLAQRASYLVQLHHWLPILEDLCARHPGSAVLCTTKAYAQTAIIFLNCFLDGSDLAYDAYLPVFEDIVATYRRLIQPQQQPSAFGSPRQQHQQQGDHLRFTLDVDLFHIITFTVSKCRDRATRRAALRLFGEMTRRQALWTNSAMLAALRALAALEDAGRLPDDGFVPASARYRYASSEWDFERRRMMAVFVPVTQAGSDDDDDVSAVRIPVRF